MKTRSLFAVTLTLSTTLLAACATTEKPKPQPAAAPAPAVTHVAPQPKANPNARTAAQIKMDELLDDPKKHAVFAKVAPALASNSQITMARGMSLADVAGYAEAGLSPDMVKAIVDGVNGL